MLDLIGVLKKYPDIYKGKAYKIENCANFLEFREYGPSNVLIRDKILNRANFCRLPLCTMCNKRRSLKIFGQTSQIMDVAEKYGYRFVFVTLTIRNVFGNELGGPNSAVKHLIKSFQRLIDRKAYKVSVHGWMRTLEITHNVDPLDMWFDTYHPHLHAIFAVKESYFRKNYISQKKLMKDWRKSAKLNYDPIVDIRAVKKGVKNGSIREVSKYVTKSSEIINDDSDLMDSAIMYLDHAISGQRLIGYGGVLKRIKADLKLEDAETGDLINTDQESLLREDLDYIVVKYRWNPGYGQYMKTGESNG